MSVAPIRLREAIIRHSQTQGSHLATDTVPGAARYTNPFPFGKAICLIKPARITHVADGVALIIMVMFDRWIPFARCIRRASGAATGTCFAFNRTEFWRITQASSSFITAVPAVAGDGGELGVRERFEAGVGEGREAEEEGEG